MTYGTTENENKDTKDNDDYNMNKLETLISAFEKAEADQASATKIRKKL